MEFVPQSSAATRAARPSRRRVSQSRRRVSPPAATSPNRSATHAPTASSPPASHQATCACRHLTPRRVPPTPPLGTWPGPVRRNQRIAFGRIAAVAVGQRGSVHLRPRLTHAAGRLEPSDQDPQRGVHQPVARRHGRPVAEEGLVGDHHRATVGAANHDGEGAARVAAEEPRHRLGVALGTLRWPVGASGAQRQNSRACTMRETNPPDDVDLG